MFDKELHESRIMNKLSETDTEKCWLMSGGLDKDGYSYLTVRGTSWRAHRLAHILWIGPIPEGYVVDHRCWSRHCVNPKHLRLLTAAENCGWDARKVYLGPPKPKKTQLESAMRKKLGICRKGHVLSEVGTITKNGPNKKPTCRMCQMITQTNHREANGLSAVLTGRINGKRDPDLPKSGIKGISWSTQANRWNVAVYHNGKNHYNGQNADLTLAIEQLKELHERIDYPENKRIYA